MAANLAQPRDAAQASVLLCSTDRTPTQEDDRDESRTARRVHHAHAARWAGPGPAAAAGPARAGGPLLRPSRPGGPGAAGRDREGQVPRRDRAGRPQGAYRVLRDLRSP